MARQEIRDFVQRFWTYWLISLLLGALVGLMIVKLAKPTYETILTYEFTKTAERPVGSVDYYQYDQYYAFEVANRVMSSFVTWVSAPQTVYSLYSETGISLEGQPADALQRLVRVKSDPTSNVLTIILQKLPSRDVAQRVASGADEYQKKHFTRPGEVLIRQAAPPLVLQTGLPQPFVIGGAALAALVLVFSVTLLWFYLSEEPAA